MSKEWLKNLFKIELEFSDAVLGLLPDPIAKRAKKIRTEIITAAQEATSDFLKQRAGEEKGSGAIREVKIE